MRLPSPTEWDNVYRILLAAAALAGCWWLAGSLLTLFGVSKSYSAIGFLLAAPLVGKLLAPVVFDGLVFGYHAARWLALHPLQGNYYSYRGNAIGVLEDDEGFRWLRVSDIRRTLQDLPKDSTLRTIEPERTDFDESGKRLAMRADALVHWLSKAHTAEHIRFKVWVERSIHNPSLAVRREIEKKAIRHPVV
jgi:hypothetical protein